ncbi:MAG: hypothetical protein ACI4WF_01885, partial [Bacilli bacterium]
FLDTWYENNIVGKTDSNGVLLTSYIVDGSFCNDRSFASTNNGDGYSLVPETIYSGFKRLNVDANKSATLKCSNLGDKFSTTASKGNAKLKHPVALITADELALAGAKYGIKNLNFYLRTTDGLVSMTPSRFFTPTANAHVFNLHPEGGLSAIAVGNRYSVRAVINLRSDVLISQGDGTMENPYFLKLS